ncbi:hypothetical protein BgiBS90_031138, partial [Biomphalaria glabrata]
MQRGAKILWRVIVATKNILTEKLNCLFSSYTDLCTLFIWVGSGGKDKKLVKSWKSEIPETRKE